MKFDEIGYWSEVKLEIVRDYASEYSKILSAQTKPPFYHIYIDAFAGAGVHISRESKEFVPGSPINALLVEPPFREYHFIDLDEKKIENLKQAVGSRNDVFIYPGDCNQILLKNIFPKAKWEEYRRALCLLDPYGLHLNWDVIAKAGSMRSIEIFLNFPVADINRNVLWRDREGVPAEQIERMNKFWGDDSWKKVAYTESKQLNLLGEPEEEKSTNEEIAEAFRMRLQDVAGFEEVPKPMPMRNQKNAIVYYLFFASHKPVAKEIVEHIFKKYYNRMGGK
jgi:three-Cys-motif partner protein